MKRILAIASIAIRNAIRSRMVISLLVLLLVTIVAIPLTVQGDGTPEGQVRIVIGYTMGFASALLGLTSLWAGALAVAQEIAERQAQVLATKPVHRAEIWIGKWLGLMAVNAVLLAASGGATYALFRWTTSERGMAKADRAHLMNEILSAHRSVRPEPVDVEAEAQRLVSERIERGEIPEDVARAAALQAVRQELLLKASSVPPGGRHDWSFHLPHAPEADQPLTLRFRFSSSEFGLESIRGTWLAGTPAHPAIFRATATNVPSAMCTVRIPSEAIGSGKQLDITYVNDNEVPVTVVFAPADGIQVLVREGGFEGNFARALVVVLARLAFLTALGVTAGALFSTPVAVFMSMALLLLLQLGSYVESLATLAVIIPWHDVPGAGPTWVDVALRLFFKGLSLLLAPVGGTHALDDAATGLLVDGGMLLRAVLVQVVVYGGVLALAGTYVFNRRELALPST